MRRFHYWMTFVWFGVLAAAVSSLWIDKLAFLIGVAFVSLCSIYANAVGHFGAYQAARAEENSPDAEEE